MLLGYVDSFNLVVKLSKQLSNVSFKPLQLALEEVVFLSNKLLGLAQLFELAIFVAQLPTHYAATLLVVCAEVRLFVEVFGTEG